MIDIHSHILPGIDDGAKTFEESLEILRGLSAQGFTDVILTPHFINGTAQVSPRFENQNLYNLLRAKVRHEDIPVNLYLGNEIYIDRDIEKLIRFGKIKSLGSSQFLLIELPMSGEYGDYESIFAGLMQKGYKVILAHPERYRTAQKDYEILERLNDMGVLFQCNFGSLVGQYGKEAQKTIKRLAKDGLIFCMGTDIHHERDYSEIAEAKERLEKFFSEEELELILDKNPRQIIASF